MRLNLAISRRIDLHLRTLRTEIQPKPARTRTVPTQHTVIVKLYFYNCATKCICVPGIFFGIFSQKNYFYGS